MATCIITGAGSGIGRATAIEMSRRNDYDTLYLIGRNPKGLEETVSMLSPGKEIRIKQFDLIDLDGIPGLVKEIYQESGNIQCLLNIAGSPRFC